MKSGLLPELPKPTNSLNGWPWDKETDIQHYENEIQWPRITIITPSLNQGRYIEHTIRSILLQNYPNIQFLVFDGGSDDETISIIDKYEAWIDHWVSEQDNGQSHAINKGLAIAEGTLINWINSDDYLEEKALFSIAQVYLKTPKALLVAKSRIIGKDISISDGTFISRTLSGTLSRFRYDQPATYFTKRVLENIGKLDESLHLVMDADYWISFLLEFNLDDIAIVDQVVVSFREHELSKTVNNRNEIVVERARLLSVLISSIDHGRGKYSERLLNVGSPKKKELKTGAVSFILYWFKHYVKEGDRECSKEIRSLIDVWSLTIKEFLLYWKIVIWDGK